MKRLACLVAGASTLLLSGVAMAQDATAGPVDAAPVNAFGGAGQISIQSDLQLSFQSTSFSAPDGGEDPESRTTITLAPALDYFVADNISIGGQLGYTSTSQGDASSSAITIGPRVGYNLSLSDQVSFWPRLGLWYSSISSETEVTVPDGMGGTTTQTADVSGSKMGVSIFAPFLVHLADHFFVGIGPNVDMDLSSKVEDEDSVKETSFGVRSVVGGWF